ncbi:glycosyltransferase [Blautia schinkii]|nr:glycosyltransferase [Blautia schinkii]
MKKIIVVGHFDNIGHSMNGASVKARSILDELQNQFGSKSVSTVDIFNWRYRKFTVVINIIKAFICAQNIVAVISDTSHTLIQFFHVLKILFHRKIIYSVVGGDMAELLHQKKEIIQMLRKTFDAFLVETIDCRDDMIALGLMNTHLMRNFKCIDSITEDMLPTHFEAPFSFCTFSRVAEEKGIADAITAINLINDSVGYNLCRLDIYGEIEESYEINFNKLLETSSCCRYCGIVDSSNSTNILKTYYCLLFPTKFQTEGIPGTIIDGFACGIPIICSDWCRCRQLITDKFNGLIYPFDDFEAFVDTILFAICNQDLLKNMRKNCLKSFLYYRSDIAIMPLLKLLD